MEVFGGNACQPVKSYYLRLYISVNYQPIKKKRPYYYKEKICKASDNYSVSNQLKQVHYSRPTVATFVLLALREVQCKIDSLVLTMYKTLPTDWLTYMFKIFCIRLSAPVSVHNTHLPPHSISFTHNASLATALLTPRTLGAIWRVITELPNNFPH